MTRDSSPPDAISRSGRRAHQDWPRSRTVPARSRSPPAHRERAPLQSRLLHREFAQALADRARERRRARTARRAEARSERGVLAQRSFEPRFDASSATSAPTSSSRRARQRSACSSTASTVRRACAPGGRSLRGALELLEPTGLGLRRVAVTAQLACQVSRFDDERPARSASAASAGHGRRRLQARASRCERTTGARSSSSNACSAPAAASRSTSRLRNLSRSIASSSRSPLRRVDLLDLAQLELEQVELALARARELVQMRQLTARRAQPRTTPPARLAVARCSGPQARSRISSCAAASISLRCSCWP